MPVGYVWITVLVLLHGAESQTQAVPVYRTVPRLLPFSAIPLVRPSQRPTVQASTRVTSLPAGTGSTKVRVPPAQPAVSAGHIQPMPEQSVPEQALVAPKEMETCTVWACATRGEAKPAHDRAAVRAMATTIVRSVSLFIAIRSSAWSSGRAPSTV
jgi:hypothetical protein